MNYKELPHAPENAQNFDGEDLVKQCPGEASARESQDCLSQRKAGCMNFAVYKFIFSCTRSLVPNTLLLADSDSSVCLEIPAQHRRLSGCRRKWSKSQWLGTFRRRLF